MASTASSGPELYAFLFTDIEGSSLLWLNHRAVMQEALAAHDAVMREMVLATTERSSRRLAMPFLRSFIVRQTPCARRRTHKSRWAQSLARNKCAQGAHGDPLRYAECGTGTISVRPSIVARGCCLSAMAARCWLLQQLQS